MDNMETEAAEKHEQAAHHLELAAQMHRDAAKQCLSGNYAKAQSLAVSASEADTVANRHALEAVDLYRHHDEKAAEQRPRRPRKRLSVPPSGKRRTQGRSCRQEGSGAARPRCSPPWLRRPHLLRRRA